MNPCYVEEREGAYWVTGTRVSLDSIVQAFFAGQTAETIAGMFPVVSLEQVYGAVAYYLAHRVQIDEYLRRARTDFEAMREASRKADPAFYQKLADARRQMQAVGQ